MVDCPDLWGQFLRRDRSVRSDVASRFLACIARAADAAELAGCFPFAVLAATAPVEWFTGEIQ